MNSWTLDCMFVQSESTQLILYIYTFGKYIGKRKIHISASCQSYSFWNLSKNNVLNEDIDVLRIIIVVTKKPKNEKKIYIYYNNMIFEADIVYDIKRLIVITQNHAPTLLQCSNK